MLGFMVLGCRGVGLFMIVWGVGDVGVLRVLSVGC